MPLKLTFDLMDLLNSTETRANQKALASFVKRDAIKREFGNRVIDAIKARTLSGKDKKNKTFVGAKDKAAGKYSDMYKSSLEYKVYGKTDKVNLKLTGQMQASMTVVGTTATGVSIDFVSDAQAKKARGHINGAGPLPVRDFWGLDKKGQMKILKSVIKDFNASEEQADLFSAVSALTSGAELVGAGSETASALSLASSIDIFGDSDG